MDILINIFITIGAIVSIIVVGSFAGLMLALAEDMVVETRQAKIRNKAFKKRGK
ncbi:hypothetical protein AAK938_01385 [Aerococcaceae bacterium 50-4]